jgi:hypothetical protein
MGAVLYFVQYQSWGKNAASGESRAKERKPASAQAQRFWNNDR